MDKFKRNAFFIRLGLIFMVGLCIASFSLFPKQYAYPSSVTASSVDQSRRTTLKQRLDYLDLDNQIANRGKVKRHKFNEDQSRLSGDEILANRTSYSIDNQKNKDGIKSASSQPKAKAVTNYYKENFMLKD